MNPERPLLHALPGRALRYLASKEQRVTPRQLVEAWRAKRGAKALPGEVIPDDSLRPRGLQRSTCERLVLHMLCLGILADDFNFTAFSVVHYVVTGARAHALEAGSLRVAFEMPAAEARSSGLPALADASSAKQNGAVAGDSGTGSKGKGKRGTTASRGAAGEARGDGIKGAREHASGQGRGKGQGARKTLPAPETPGGAASAREGRGARGRAERHADDTSNVVDLCASDDEDGNTPEPMMTGGGLDSTHSKRAAEKRASPRGGGQPKSGGRRRGDTADASNDSYGEDDGDSDFEDFHGGKQAGAKRGKKKRRKAMKIDVLEDSDHDG